MCQPLLQLRDEGNCDSDPDWSTFADHVQKSAGTGMPIGNRVRLGEHAEGALTDSAARNGSTLKRRHFQS